MPAHSPLKKALRQKQYWDNTEDALQKKHKAHTTSDQPSYSTSKSLQPCHSGRAGVGVGGRILQLEQIGIAIEGPPHILRLSRLVLLDDLTRRSRGAGD